MAPCSRNAEIARAFISELARLRPNRIRIAGREFGPPRATPAARKLSGHDDRALEAAFGSADDYLDVVNAGPRSSAEPTEIPGIPQRWVSTLSPGFLRKAQGRAAALALFFTIHNFTTADDVQRVSSAMAAGIADHVWDVSELTSLLRRTFASESPLQESGSL